MVQARDDLAQRPGPVRRRRAVGSQDQDPRIRRALHQVPEQFHRRGTGPLKVLEHQHQRRIFRSAAKRRHHGVIQPPPIPWLRSGRRDVHPARHSRKQIQPQIVPGPSPVLKRNLAPANRRQQHTNRLVERLIRRAQFSHTRTEQHYRFIAVKGTRSLSGQARFPRPRLTSDEHHTARTRSNGRPDLRQNSKIAPAADERRLLARVAPPHGEGRTRPFRHPFSVGGGSSIGNGQNQLGARHSELD